MLSRDHTETCEIGNAVTAALACGARAETSRLVRLLRSARISTPSSAQAVRRSDAALQLYGIRRERNQFFSDDLFGEPAWDILLILYWAELEQLRLTVSNVCEGAQVPPTTALRWISKLEADGMICRTSHPSDRRVIRLSLSTDAIEQLNQLMDRVLASGLAKPHTFTAIAA